MLNKDCNYIIPNEDTARRFKNYEDNLSQHDQWLLNELKNEVNAKGYYIQYFAQLSALDKNDKSVVPVLLKYYDLFENQQTNNSIIRLIGKSRLQEITSFLLKEFKKANTESIDWNGSRRGCASSALHNIRDKRFIDEYIELIRNPDTRYDSGLIGTMLGKMKAEKALPVLVEALEDPHIGMQYMGVQALWHFKGRTELIPYIEPLLSSPDKTLRSYAKNAINKINGKRGNSEMER